MDDLDRLKKELMKEPGFERSYRAAWEVQRVLDTLILARRDSGMKVRDVAEALGWSKKQVRRFEQGLLTHLSHLLSYADAVGVKMEIILTTDPEGG